jgi:hypothetical protein
LDLSAGTHRIQVSIGDRKQEFTIEVRDGAIISRTIEFTP